MKSVTGRIQDLNINPSVRIIAPDPQHRTRGGDLRNSKAYDNSATGLKATVEKSGEVVENLWDN